MSKGTSDSKKLTLIYLQQLFLEKTDKTHFVRMPEILSFLESKDIFVDRRTIYTDLKLLNYAGFEVVGVPEKGGYKYHHPSRLFSINELKFLIDSVASSKFLTSRKSRELIEKIKQQGSNYANESLNRNILLAKRVKSMNDKVFKNLDILYEAIATNSQISFKYTKLTPERTIAYTNSGAITETSPFAVTLNDDNYYFIAYDKGMNSLRHYRVDKLDSLQLLPKPREGKELFKSFDIVDYTQKTFSMFSGREETVTIEAYNSLAGAFFDKFGEAVHIRKCFENPNHFIARVNVTISPQFYAWIFGFERKVKILSPASVQEEFVETARKILDKYKRENP